MNKFKNESLLPYQHGNKIFEETEPQIDESEEMESENPKQEETREEKQIITVPEYILTRKRMCERYQIDYERCDENCPLYTTERNKCLHMNILNEEMAKEAETKVLAFLLAHPIKTNLEEFKEHFSDHPSVELLPSDWKDWFNLEYQKRGEKDGANH